MSNQWLTHTKNIIALNGLAQKKPCSQLSEYWQCTTLHKCGSVMQAKETLTVYQPVKLTKYNSLHVFEKKKFNAPSSTNRLHHLFSPASVETSSCSIPQDPGFKPRETDNNAHFASCSIAVIERDVAVAAQNKISKDHGHFLQVQHCC
jgi:hypothetical protein